MFTLLSPQSISQRPVKTALYISCGIHLCALALTVWFAAVSDSVVPFRLVAVFAGTEEPVRTPQRLYLPLRSLPGNTQAPISSDLGLAAAEQRPEAPHEPQSAESRSSASFLPTSIPSDLLGLLDAQSGSQPAMAVQLAGTRPIAPPVHVEPSLPPPEPPPGEPDVKPTPVIGGHLVPAQIIKQPSPAYPPLARSARVEGVVVLEATVNVSGTLENIRIVEGHPMLVDEALKTVRRWKYRPAVLNGQTIPSPVTITVRFILKYGG